MFQKHTDFVQLHQVKFGARLGQELLGLLTVGAEGLAKDGDGVLVDDLLCLFFRGHDFLGWWGRTVPED